MNRAGIGRNIMPFGTCFARICGIDWYVLCNVYVCDVISICNLSMDLDKGTLTWQTPVYSKKASRTKKIGIAAFGHQKNHGFLTKFTLGFRGLDLRISGGLGLNYPRFGLIIPEVYTRIP